MNTNLKQNLIIEIHIFCVWHLKDGHMFEYNNNEILMETSQDMPSLSVKSNLSSISFLTIINLDNN